MPMINGRRQIQLLTIIAITVLLIGPTLIVADAAFLPYAKVTKTQSFDRAENNHTYVYVGGSTTSTISNSFMIQEEDVDITSYSYGRTSWTESIQSYSGPAEREYFWSSGSSANWGWLSDPINLPRFYDLTTEKDDTELGAKQFYNVFPLTVGEENTLFMESGYYYVGTFNVTTEEFFHMTLTGHQDENELMGLVFDFQWRAVTEFYLDGGDIEVVPFASYGNGTYYVMVWFYGADPAPAPLDILIEPVVPESIDFGEMVEGNLPGNEFVIDEDGSYIYEEKRPVIYTYKFSANATQYGCLSFLLNEPDIPLATYQTQVIITSTFYIESNPDYAWMYMPNTPSDIFYYSSFINETYYITIQGMGNTDFEIYNRLVDIPDLPLNDEFFIQNWQAAFIRVPYKLNLGQDSVLRINRTEWNSGFEWELWTMKDNERWDTLILSEGSTFESASTIYLPAGRYLIIATSKSQTASGLYEFNLGPVIDGVGNVNIDVDRILGVRVPVEDLTFYRSNFTLLTHDNITLDMDIDFMHQDGYIQYSTIATLGNRQSGTGWVAFGVNTTSYELGLDDTSYSQFLTGHVIIALAPYRVTNNTGGGGGNELFGRSVDIAITFDEDADRIITAENTVTVGNDFIWSNFTLSATGDTSERYALRMTITPGIWVNISLHTDDVTSGTIYMYQDINGRPIYLTSGSIGYTFTGTLTDEGAFQFGSVGSEILIVIDVQRSLLDEGRLDIGIQPMTTNTFESPPLPTYYSYGATPGPVPLGVDPALAIGGVAVIGIVVVVVVIVLKKKGKI